jgi:glucose-1-phosphate adenylyltransferase
MPSSLVMIMAGGKGARLGPLTCHRAKPAVPFGGRYRIIDFVLSNFANSGYGQIYVLTQYMASSLISHIGRNWHLGGLGQFIEVVPAQMRHGVQWYRGTADAVFQNLNLVRDAHADNVAVFGGDHIFKFNVAEMERAHRDSRADLTVAACPMSCAEAAHQFGVIEVDEAGRILGFQEKPAQPRPIPGQPERCLVSMGNYFFKSGVLEQVLIDDATREDSHHDFGHNVIPRMVKDGMSCRTYDLSSNRIPGEADGTPHYWRDVGTLDGYFAANMDLRASIPPLSLYNFRWRIRSAQRNFPPARFVMWGDTHRQCEVVDSMVCEGTIVCAATLRDVLAGYDCFFHKDCVVEDSVIQSGNDIGAGARLRRVLTDKNCAIAPGTVIGEDPEEDRRRFPFITERGVVVLPKGTFVPRIGPIELVSDVEEALLRDDATRAPLLEFQGRFVTAKRSRHSHDSVGPRFLKFGPDGIA